MLLSWLLPAREYRSQWQLSFSSSIFSFVPTLRPSRFHTTVSAVRQCTIPSHPGLTNGTRQINSRTHVLLLVCDMRFKPKALARPMSMPMPMPMTMPMQVQTAVSSSWATTPSYIPSSLEMCQSEASALEFGPLWVFYAFQFQMRHVTLIEEISNQQWPYRSHPLPERVLGEPPTRD